MLVGVPTVDRTPRFTLAPARDSRGRRCVGDRRWELPVFKTHKSSCYGSSSLVELLIFCVSAGDGAASLALQGPSVDADAPWCGCGWPPLGS